MFAKDVQLLNELYSHKIHTEMNIGPHGDQDPGVGLSPDKIQKVQMPPTRPCLKCSDCEEDQEEHIENISNHEGTNASMTKQSLYRLTKLSAMLHDLICNCQDIEPWVLTKVTEALNHVESVYGYMDYEDYKQQVETDIANIAEETEHDLYSSILQGGTNILSTIRTILAKESKDNLEQLLYETITALEKKK